jgi:SPW repeat-containing protein
VSDEHASNSSWLARWIPGLPETSSGPARKFVIQDAARITPDSASASRGGFPMRFIPTRVHGIIDYVMGVLLIIAPWVLGFNRGGAETWVPVVLGAGVIVYSLLTQYELGVAKVIPMPVHLGLDMAGGTILAVSPWLFGFADQVWMPHVVLGILEIGVALFTQTVPALQSRHETRMSA